MLTQKLDRRHTSAKSTGCRNPDCWSDETSPSILLSPVFQSDRPEQCQKRALHSQDRPKRSAIRAGCVILRDLTPAPGESSSDVHSCTADGRRKGLADRGECFVCVSSKQLIMGEMKSRSEFLEVTQWVKIGPERKTRRVIALS